MTSRLASWPMWLATILLLGMAVFPAAGAERLDSKLELTQEEELFLRDHPVIRVHNETQWPPFNFFEDGKPQGYSIEYMNLLAQMIGVEVDYVTGPTWNAFLGMMKSGDLDVMLNIVKTPEREKYLLYTKAYALNPNSILSSRDTPYDSLEQLFGKTVALPKGFFYEEILKRDFPQIKLHLGRDVEESMKAVIFGKADAALGEQAVFNYLMERKMMTGLVLSGEVKLGGSNYSELNIATRKDLPLLISILRKAMAAVPPEKIKALRQRWITITQTADKGPNIKLTAEEEAWIKDHPIVQMAALRDWPPFDFQDESGRHVGIAPELARLAADRVGLTLNPVFDEWDVLLSRLKAGELDMVSSIYKTPEREPFHNFTEPYLELYDAIFTAGSTSNITKTSDLKGRIVAVEKGFYTIDILTRDFPEIELLVVNNTQEALMAVSTGKADAYIGTQYVGSHLIKKYVIPNLKTVGFLGDEPNRIYMSTRKGAPILRDILDKALASISDEEKQEILRKFIVLDGGARKVTDLVKLTVAEKAWLADHKHMRFSVDPGYPPFEFIDDNGVFSGMSSDYIRLVGERLGITMEMVPGLSWADTLSGLKDRSLDFSPAVGVTDERKAFMNFARPHMAFPVVIITRDDYTLVAGLADLSGARASLVTEFAVTEQVIARYPGVIANIVETPLQALESVAQGKTEAAVMNLAVATYLIKKHSLANLKVAAPAGIDLPGLSFAVRGDWPEFAGILDKALASITPEEESAIRSKWAQVSYNTGIDVEHALQVSGAVAVVLIIIVVWNRRLRREVTQRKLAEQDMEAAKNEAERLTQAKSDFIAVISHEIRTPMNGVLGMARLLTETKLDDEQKECVDTVVESGEALLTIIDDLLDISKFDAGKLEMESLPFMVDAVVAQSLALMKSRAEEKGLALSSTIDANITTAVIGDPLRLRQIILNLISNAIKFTDKGSITVDAKLEQRTEDAVFLSFIITDTGKGISPEAQEKLFSAYAQGSAAVARKYGGTGLGLAICRRLAHLMDGEITLDSTLGKGSVFRFDAKFGIDELSDIEALRKQHMADQAPPTTRRSAHPLRVLQVEDNQTNRIVIERALSKVGHIVTSVEHGELGLAALTSGDFDVVIMDRHMPVMDGLEASRRIRELDGPLADIPIIGLTASASQEDIDACINAGMNECLVKPVEATKLRALLETLAGGQELPAPQFVTGSIVATDTDPAPVDLAQLSRIIGDEDPNELFAMLAIFTTEFPKLLASLETALGKRAAGDVHTCAHTAKGAAANAAAPTLSGLLKDIETDAHLEDWDHIAALVDAVGTEYGRVADFCKSGEGLT